MGAMYTTGARICWITSVPIRIPLGETLAVVCLTTPASWLVSLVRGANDYAYDISSECYRAQRYSNNAGVSEDRTYAHHAIKSLCDMGAGELVEMRYVMPQSAQTTAHKSVNYQKSRSLSQAPEYRGLGPVRLTITMRMMAVNATAGSQILTASDPISASMAANLVSLARRQLGPGTHPIMTQTMALAGVSTAVSQVFVGDVSPSLNWTMILPLARLVSSFS